MERGRSGADENDDNLDYNNIDRDQLLMMICKEWELCGNDE
jgi:hypothetical protein